MSNQPCPECQARVPQKAVGCARCGNWYHPACCNIPDSIDYKTIVKLSKTGWKWYCGECLPKAEESVAEFKTNEDLKTSIVNEVSGAITAVALEIREMNERIANLETKTTTPDVPSFAEIIQQTLDSSKKEGAQHTTQVVDGGMKKTVWDHQVLVVKPKDAAAEQITQPEKKKIETALASVPVTSCSKTNTGALVVKFPTKKAKENASKAIKESLGTDTSLNVTEPKKMLPKMTIVGVSSDVQDNEIVPSILNKNLKIKSLVDDGFTFSLLFTRQRSEDAQTKVAIIKMSPEIRSAIVDEGGSVFVGLTRCKSYDRFWVTQCYHCQGFGHSKDRCAKISDRPICGFCAGDHESKSCSSKESPKCINCVNSSPTADSETPTPAHFASSRHCPIMISQRRKVIENTNFTISKN